MANVSASLAAGTPVKVLDVPESNGTMIKGYVLFYLTGDQPSAQ